MSETTHESGAFGPIPFVFTANEWVVALAAADRLAGTSRSVMAVNATLCLVSGTFEAYAGLGGSVRGHHLAPWYLPLGVLQLTLGTAIFVVITKTSWLRRRLARPSRETTIAVDERGISLSDGRARVVPWFRVQRITDLGEVFAIDAGLRRTFVPKRIFDDRGTRFWAFANDRLVGRRMLAGARSRTVIVNTVAARR